MESDVLDLSAYSLEESDEEESLDLSSFALDDPADLEIESQPARSGGLIPTSIEPPQTEANMTPQQIADRAESRNNQVDLRDWPNRVRALKKAAASDVGINESQFGALGKISDAIGKGVTDTAISGVDAINNLSGNMPERQNMGASELTNQGVGGKIISGATQGVLTAPLFMGPGVAALGGSGLVGRSVATGADMALKGTLLSPEGQELKGAGINALTGALLPATMIPGGIAGVKALERGASPLVASAIEGTANATLSGGMSAGLTAYEGGNMEDIVASGVVGGAMGAASPKVAERVAFDRQPIPFARNDLGQPIKSEAPADAAPPLPPGEPVPTEPAPLPAWHTEQAKHDKATEAATNARIHTETMDAMVEQLSQQPLGRDALEAMGKQQMDSRAAAERAEQDRVAAEEKLIASKAKAEDKDRADAAKEKEKADKEAAKVAEKDAEGGGSKPKDAEDVETEVLKQVLPDGPPIPVEPAPDTGPRATRPPLEEGKTRISARNEDVGRERAARGLEPIMKRGRETNAGQWDEAMGVLDANPLAGTELVANLAKNPRAPKGYEWALLLHRKAENVTEMYKATQRLVKAHAAGDAEEIANINTTTAKLSGENDIIDMAGEYAGSESGRSLQARQMFRDLDFSPEHLTAKVIASNDGAPPTPEQVAEINNLVDLHQKMNAAEASKEERAADKAFNENLEAEKADVAKTQKKEARVKAREMRKQGYGKSNKIVSVERAAELRRSLIEKFYGRSNAGLDPTMLTDAIQLGLFHVEAKARDFASWSTAMVGDLGEEIRPHLDEVYAETMREYNRILSAKITDSFKAGKANIETTAKKMRRLLLEMGENDRDTIIKIVHEELSAIDPTITPSDARDAMSGYGKFKPASKDAIDMEIARLNGEMQKLGGIEDAKKGIAPKRSGRGRQKKGDEERRLEQELKQRIKDGGFNSKTPEEELASAFDSVKARLKHRISDLEEQRKTRIKSFKSPFDWRKTASPEQIAEIDSLQAQKDALQAEVDNIFGKSELTEQQQIDAAMKAVERSILEYERRLSENDYSPKAKTAKKLSTPELDAMRALRDALKADVEVLREASKPPGKTPEQKALERAIRAKERAIADRAGRLKTGELVREKTDKTSEPWSAELADLKEQLAEMNDSIAALDKDARALRMYKASLLRRTAELNEKVARGDFGPRAKREDPKLDQEATDAKFAFEQAKDKFENARFDAELAKRGNRQKVFDNVTGSFNLARAISTSWDLSAPLRQGFTLTTAHPILALSAGKKMIRAGKSEENRFKIMEQLKERTNWKNGNYKRDGVQFTDSKMNPEEAFATRFLKPMEETGKLGGAKWAGNKALEPTRASERAYTTYLNVMRAEVYDALANSFGSGDGTASPELGKVIADWVNLGSGRGGPDPKGTVAKNAMTGLNTILFAPRLWASRLQLLLGQPGWKALASGNPKAVGMVATEYARVLGGMAIIYGLGKLMGAEVEKDPRSSDFGKLKFGKTRVDVMGGFAQNIVASSRLATGETKTLTDEKIKPMGGATVLGRLFWSKLSPLFGAAVNVANRENMVGDPTTVGSTVKGLTMPMIFRDIYEAGISEGIPKTALLSILPILGAGMQTIEPREPKKKRKDDRDEPRNVARSGRGVRPTQR